jgi:ABC-type transport system involved in cytochrome c biogenesis permease subunit
MPYDSTHPRLKVLRLTVAVIAAALVVQTIIVFLPLVRSSAGERSAPRPLVPDFDYRPWESVPVQAGRIKPMQTACRDWVREITGKERFEKLDAVALVLAWYFSAHDSPAPGQTDWDHYPLILCEYQPLRDAVFEHRRSQGGPIPAGRHVAAADLHGSPGFDALLETVARARRMYRDRAHLHLSTTELRAEEVSRRLVRFDSLRRRTVTRLARNALISGEFLNLAELAAIEGLQTDLILARREDRVTALADPLHLVILDRAGCAWFSLGQLRALRQQPRRWTELIQERIAEAPQRYLAPEDAAELRRFQDQLASGRASSLTDELADLLAKRRIDAVAQFEKAHRAKDTEQANRLFNQIVRQPADIERIRKVQSRAAADKVASDELLKRMTVEMLAIRADADRATLDRLRQECEQATRRFNRDDPSFRSLYQGYLEARTPDVYQRAIAATEFPAETAARVLSRFDALRRAYSSSDPAGLAGASADCIEVLRLAADETGQPYPGVDTISAEIRFNRLRPFQWAWVVMLLASANFAIRLAGGPRVFSLFGYLLGGVALALQIYGFATRVRISGWAPVSNMYETVVFVAFMAGVFSLVLELLYRKKVLVLTGSLVATFGLILADNLPLDSGIGQLVPVLRSNYWLTVHVVTIVCGYAAGALAWGMGNVSLGMLAFGRGDRDSLKTLAQLTYRAVQLTVLLLATGTFLGGWWAAEAWGRFWGWDPKEVGALFALVCYVIPLHARYIGWVREFGLAVSAILCFGAILVSWYVINFVLAAGLHSYGFGGGGGPWVLWSVLLNLLWVSWTALRYRRRQLEAAPTTAYDAPLENLAV